MKLCLKCRTQKPKIEFSKHQGKKDKLQPFCKLCDNSRVRTHRWKTIGGVRTNIINAHGLSPRVADIMAARLFNPYERCDICGIPNRVLALHHRQGYPFIWGRAEQNRRLTIDHIIPGGPSVLGNLRLLCYGCNSRRGPNIRSDFQVLKWARYKWLRMLTKTETWWLNDKDSVGTEIRNKKHEAIIDDQSRPGRRRRSPIDNFAL